MHHDQTIIILRHAQAYDLSEGFHQDRFRDLTKKWLEQAKATWEKLLSTWVKVDIIVTSNAPRAYQTACNVANILWVDHNQIIIDATLYRCSTQKRKDTLAELQEFKTVMVVGHNPELVHLCEYYSENKDIELKKWEFHIFHS